MICYFLKGAKETEECQQAGGACLTEMDGFFLESFLCCGFGILWLALWGWRTIKRLQAADDVEWLVVKKFDGQKDYDKERLL